MLKPIEIIEDYWIIQDNLTYIEYADAKGENYMFESEQEALEFIKQIENEVISIDVSKCEAKDGDEDSFSNLDK
jgi:hypothetical protein